MTLRTFLSFLLLFQVSSQSFAQNMEIKDPPGPNCTGVIRMDDGVKWSAYLLAVRLTDCRSLYDSTTHDFDKRNYFFEWASTRQVAKRVLKNRGCYAQQDETYFKTNCAILWDGDGNGYIDMLEKQ